MSPEPMTPREHLEGWRDTLADCYTQQAIMELLEYRVPEYKKQVESLQQVGSKLWIGDLVKTAAREGWLLELLIQAAIDRPDRPEMRKCAMSALDWYKVYWTREPEPPPPLPQ